MSRSVANALKLLMAQEETHLAFLWKLELRGGTTLGFTNIDTDITYGGVVYSASSGYSSSNIVDALNASGSDVELIGLLDSVVITESDLLAGLYDGAIVSIYMLDYTLPASGSVCLFKGEIQTTMMQNGKFTAQVSSLVSYLNETITDVYSYNCRVAEFCNAECGLDVADFTQTPITVDAVTSRSIFSGAFVAPDDWYTYGKVVWLTGANATLAMDVKTFTSLTFTLFEPMPYDVEIGDTFTAIGGCDRTPERCQDLNNFVNYRGEPFMKGMDKLYAYPPLNPEHLSDGPPVYHEIP